MTKKPVYVSQPSLPALADVMVILEDIWESRMLSNRGPVLERLEAALADYLGVAHISLVANATLGAVLALQQAEVTSGEVITTPFSFVATAHAIKWAGAEPVFADIDKATLNLDPAQVEAQITPQTRAIMPVHIFGEPCDVAGLADVANRHGLKLIYDAAHAFGVQHEGRSLLSYGDMSVLSFHATKVFNTFEGGAVILPDRETKLAIDRLSNFGIRDEVTVDAIGTNAKMSEFNAAVGLAQLCHIDRVLDARRQVAVRYQKELADVPGLTCLSRTGHAGHNHYAFPIMLDADYHGDRDGLYQRLKDHGIIARRYFYPLISQFAPYRDLPTSDPAGLPVAHKVSSQILCLPLFPDLDVATQMKIIDLVRIPWA